MSEPRVVIKNIAACARCGGTHKAVRFQPFTKPPENATHWASCPQTGEPILIRVKPE
jgi:hypothetical protein